MNYQQKYEEALARAKKIHDKTVFDYDRGMMEDLFPELKESEDERIRSFLIDYIKACRWTEEKDQGLPLKEDVLAWLEKQGEQKPTDEEMKMALQTEYEKGRADAIAEMQKEQRYWNPTEEDVALFNKAVTTNTSLTPQDRAKLDIIRMKFKHHPNIEQKEQKPFDYENATITPKDFAPKDESKFKVGDWVVKNDDSYVCADYSICKITKVENGNYTIESIDGYKGYVTFKTFEKDYHIFTIEDVKDGDVLAWDDSKCIVLFKSINDENTFSGYGSVSHFTSEFDTWEFYFGLKDARPATKWERDLLFRKMKEAGYEWDADKKELKANTI